jgi:crotonobetainyl-CoA:carnitine CoA-transferase CaiB-like acyl-CoA transferase
MPVLLSGMENNENWLAPRLGEDTATVLSEYGVSIERINKLKDSKIIK